MTTTKGLKFKKFDLQVHTPGSSDFQDKSASPEDIVTAALAKGLAGIAVTDHQTGEWIDRVKAAAKTKGLVVFPAVELKVHGGKHGIHLLALFDVDKGTPHVSAFLNTLKVYEHLGSPDLITNKTAIDVARELQQFDPTAILVLAHCLSGQGAIGDMRGVQRAELFKPELHCLLGAEANEADFKDAKKIKDHDRVVDLFDGGFDGFHYKRLGVYQASDAHSLAAIGSRFTYFKVDDEITIEDIRQSLIDRDTRIRQSFEYQETLYPSIVSLQIKSGFLDGQEFEFHDGLNSILGAKGSGKSLAIEFLRFGLNQEATNEDLFIDHDSKLERCLKVHGTVEIEIVDDSGKNYLVRRTYDPTDGNPIEITDLTDGTKKEFQIEEVFPVLFLSQNEIIKIAEDKTGASQREFIDKFFDFHRYQQEIESLTEELVDLDAKFADALRAHLASNEVTKKIATSKEEIERLGRQLKNTTFDKYARIERMGGAIKGQLEFLDSIKQGLENTVAEYEDLAPPQPSDAESAADPSVKRCIDANSAVIDRIVANTKSSIEFLEEKRKTILQEFHDWQTAFTPIKTAYDTVVKDAGGTQIALDQKRKKLLLGLSKLEGEIAKHRSKAQHLKLIGERRSEIIGKLESAHRSYFEERHNRCVFFTSSSSGSLDVSIKEREDTSAFKQNLLKLKRGSWLKDDEIESISEAISPKDFIDGLLRYEFSGRQKKTLLSDIASKSGIKLENIEKLANHLLDEHNYEDILGLLYTSIPKDVPSISYKVVDEFRTLDALSVGQKAVALLIIALSEGRFPIIVDQPEDSLDLRTIWDDVCKKLRGAKDERQFIITTHNSSVAVASDTDKFTVLKADAHRGEILFSGSMNRKDIKQEVIDYLEGGTDTYNKKREKYNL